MCEKVMDIVEVKEYLNVPVQEAYGVLNTNIKYHSISEKNKSICITSYGKGEGKTATAINLAISMAKTGEKVLFVDGDMRKPKKYKKFQFECAKGCSDFVFENLSLKEIIYPTSIKNMDFIFAGEHTSNPIEVYSESRFDNFLQEVKDLFDIVIFDTPSMGSFIDAAIIASKCDGTLIVAESNNTLNKQILRIKWQLEKVNANIIGIVLNKLNKNEYKNYYIINHNYNYLNKIISKKRRRKK